MINSKSELTVEERFLWECANGWRDPATLVIPTELDWERVIEIGRHNRMQTLLWEVIQARDLLTRLPAPTRSELENDVRRLERNASVMSDALRQYLHEAAQRGVDSVVLKGLSVSTNVYDNPAMRPGGDIDIFVRQADVQASLKILDEMGIGRYWPNLMDDAYYERHHLHQQRCSPDLKIWFEIHWALDHPLTQQTINYEAMIDRATPGSLLGEPVMDLSPADLLLSLAIHLVKHAVYLPATVERPDLQRIILADGMLMYYLDIAEVLKLWGDRLDWLQLIALTKEGGIVDMVGSVLRVCQRYLQAAVPKWVLAQLPVGTPGLLTRRAMDGIVEYETATYLGEAPSKLWDFLLVTNGAFILRPIRVLDLASYLFPSRDYLRRRYGNESVLTAAAHTIRATGQYTKLGIDTLYFTWERYRRLKAMNESTSLFNRLDTEA